MIEYPLTKANRITLGRTFRDIKRVDIAIDSIIEGQMGEAFVDDLTNPRIFKLQVGPFCYFAGDFESVKLIEITKYIEPCTLIMTCPDRVISMAREIFGQKLIQFPRYSFSSEKLSLEHIGTLFDASPFRSRISRIEKYHLEEISGHPDHFLDISTYDSVEDFLVRGIGYCLTENNKLVAVGYASLVSNTGIEVSIYVESGYRRKGVATALGCALIKDCLQRNIDPHWDAANVESCTLAEKLGYIPTDTYDAYYVSQ